MNGMKALIVTALLALSVVAYPHQAAAQTPISACGFIINSPGPYFVTGNLSAGSGADCVTVQANDVSINLNGFVMTSDGSGAGITDGAVGRSGIAIIFGTIRNFNVGIELTSSTNVIIESMRVFGNTLDGIHVGARSSLRSHVVNNNGTLGVIVTCPSLLIGNIAEGNPGGGLVTSGAGCKKFNNNF